MSITSLAAQWLEAKREEETATSKRRAIEDVIKKLQNIPEDLDKTVSFDDDGYKVSVTGRIDRKVDSEKLQELAAEAGLTDHLGSLFRWKPEINATAWKLADDKITRPLSGAITAKPGRASFKIAIKE